MALTPEDIQDLLAYRERLLDVLVEQDAKIRKLFIEDGIELAPDLDHMPALVEFRDVLNLTQDEYEAETKKISGWMGEALKVGGIPKWESASHIVQIMSPPDRVSFNEEVAKTELILAGVQIDKIVDAFAKARKVTPVASFVRVDARKARKKAE